MKYNNEKARQENYNYTIATYKKIEVKSGKARFNYRCQYNSVHEAKKNKDKKLAMTIYFDERNHVYIHFVNYRNKQFIDNTLGQWSKQHTYYFVRWISEDEMWNIDDIFMAFRKEMRNKLNWWTRLTSDYKA